MDPATLALIGIAALAATTIKRGVRPPAPAPSPEPETETEPTPTVPDFFRGSARWYPVSAKQMDARRSRETTTRADEPREFGEEPAKVSPIGPSRAETAIAASPAADVGGSVRGSVPRPRPLLTPQQAVFGPGGGPGTKVQGGTLF